MDPDEALARTRSAATAIRETGDPARVVELLEGFEALDGWLSSGGFVPAEWSGAAGPAVTREALYEALLDSPVFELATQGHYDSLMAHLVERLGLER